MRAWILILVSALALSGCAEPSLPPSAATDETTQPTMEDVPDVEQQSTPSNASVAPGPWIRFANATIFYDIAVGGLTPRTLTSGGCGLLAFDVSENASSAEITTWTTPVNLSETSFGYATHKLTPPDESEPLIVTSPPSERTVTQVAEPKVGQWTLAVLPYGATVAQHIFVSVTLEGSGLPPAALELEPTNVCD